SPRPSLTWCPSKATPAGRPRGVTRATTTGPGRPSWSAPWPTAAKVSMSPGTTASRSPPSITRRCKPGPTMLTTERLEQILDRIPGLTVAVLGDLFLDRYLDLDASLTEPSLETGLDAYQVVQVRAQPGAAGTVLNNLAALGVGRILLATI